MCHTGLAFQEKVPVTLHLIIINFCIPQDLPPIFLSTVVQTGHAKKLNGFDMSRIDDLHLRSALEQ